MLRLEEALEGFVQRVWLSISDACASRFFSVRVSHIIPKQNSHAKGFPASQDAAEHTQRELQFDLAR